MVTWEEKDAAQWYNEHAGREDIPDDQVVSVPSARYKLIANDIRHYVHLMGFTDGDCVLDAGCGAGRFIHVVRETSCCQIFGVDASRNMVKRAKRRIPDGNYLCASVLKLPFKNATFTVVICHSVLWHIPSKTGGYFNGDVYNEGLKEYKRVPRTGGRGLFNICNPFHLQSIVEFAMYIVRFKLLMRGSLQTYKVSLKRARKVLGELDFEVSETVPKGYYPLHLETLFFPLRKTLSEKMITQYHKAFSWLENLATRRTWLHALAHVLVIKVINKPSRNVSVY